MTGQWERVQPEVSIAGHVGGDLQVSDAYSARWRRPLPDGNTALVSRAYFAAAGDRSRPNVATRLDCDTEYLICRDPSEPGGTEEWSDGRFAVVDILPATDWDARRAAAEAEEPTDEEWNGHAPAWAQVAA